jgi:hypothetical protein
MPRRPRASARRRAPPETGPRRRPSRRRSRAPVAHDESEASIASRQRQPEREARVPVRGQRAASLSRLPQRNRRPPGQCCLLPGRDRRRVSPQRQRQERRGLQQRPAQCRQPEPPPKSGDSHQRPQPPPPSPVPGKHKLFHGFLRFFLSITAVPIVGFFYYAHSSTRLVDRQPYWLPRKRRNARQGEPPPRPDGPVPPRGEQDSYQTVSRLTREEEGRSWMIPTHSIVRTTPRGLGGLRLLARLLHPPSTSRNARSGLVQQRSLPIPER